MEERLQARSEHEGEVQREERRGFLSSDHMRGNCWRIWAAPAAYVLLAIILASGLAAAQISPGPLARAHQSLNGSNNCTTCHKLSAGQPTFKCLECHTEIAGRLAAHGGLHASYKLEPGSSQGCVRCHSDHNGEDFQIVKWNPSQFDHRQTGYVLEGKHAGLACNKCHNAEHVVSDRALIKVRDLNKTFLGVAEACGTCHKDPHQGRLGANCKQCHNFEDWKSVATIKEFDHSKTRYPLTGMHAQVTCQKCHTPGTDGKPRYAGIPFGQCSDCHADIHHGSFKQTCQSCHTTAGWKKISTGGLSENFDHSKTKYPLMGKHAQVECIQCHAKGDFKKPVAFAKCMDCHTEDPHKGQFAKRAGGIECANCHTVEGFKPSTFTVKEHASSAYPLQGKHAEVKCEQCHLPKGKDTLFKVKFQQCTDCHNDRHAGQFAAAPWLNKCDQCHNLEGYRPSTFSLARHKQTRFLLTGGHAAVTCAECHKELIPVGDKMTAIYHWQNLDCTSCHNDPHKGQFKERMLRAGLDGKAAGCEACHTTKSWKELSRFDHSKTDFPLVGAHRATACADCHKPPNLETKLTNVDFKTAPTKCEECHEDIHGKQFAQNGITSCVGCHNSTKWKPALFDHDKRTSFPLAGAHQRTRCAQCHALTKMVEGKKVLFYKPTPKDCAACHGPEIKKKS
jgi:hypothetical protein